MDAEIQLKTSLRTVVIATGLPDTGEYVFSIPDAVGETAQATVRNSCDAAAVSVDSEFVITPSQALSGFAWELVTDKTNFPPVDGAGALVFNGCMWLMGGWDPLYPKLFPKITSNAAWSSVDGTTWTEEKSNSYGFAAQPLQADWEGRHTAGYAVLNNTMIIIGGDTVSGHYQHDVWSSSTGKEWALLGDDAAGPLNHRVLFYTFAHQDKVCIFGGQTIPQFIPDDEIFYSDVWCTADGSSWSEVATTQTPPPRGAIMGQAVLNGEVWIMGGGTYHTPTSSRRTYNDVWKSADLKQWTLVSKAAPWEPRFYQSVAVFQDRLWVIGGAVGDAGEQPAETWYSADGYNWYSIPSPWQGRHATGVYVHLDSLWLVGGGVPDADGLLISDVWRLRKPAIGAPLVGRSAQ